MELINNRIQGDVLKMGIIADLSKYQGNIDFAKLSKVVDGVILRVQCGSTIPDAKYAEYVAGCKANNIKFGTYAYFKGINVNDAIQEAKDAYARMDKSSVCFALDIEEVSMSDLVAGGQAFIDYLHQQGVQHVGLYSGESFYKQHNLSAIKCDWHWIAKYGTNDGQQHTQPSVDDDLWQFTSVGRIDGIAGNVDLDVITDGNHFNFFDSHIVVAPSPTQSDTNSLSPQFCTKQAILQTLRCDGHTDIRVAPNHASQYVRDTQPGEIFHVFDKVTDAQGHCWNNLGGANWVDEASGIFYWLDNPNLQKPSTPQAQYYVIANGDTLSRIAAKFGTSISQLQNWNGIKNPNVISAGKKIRVK